MSLYSEGASDTEVRADLSITYSLWNELLLLDTEFEDVIRHGKMLAKAWWLKQGRKNLTTKEFNSNLYKINMQNRFNWSDKANTVDEEPDEEFRDEGKINEILLKAMREAASGSSN